MCTSMGSQPLQPLPLEAAPAVYSLQNLALSAVVNRLVEFKHFFPFVSPTGAH